MREKAANMSVMFMNPLLPWGSFAAKAWAGNDNTLKLFQVSHFLGDPPHAR